MQLPCALDAALPFLSVLVVGLFNIPAVIIDMRLLFRRVPANFRTHPYRCIYRFPPLPDNAS